MCCHVSQFKTHLMKSYLFTLIAVFILTSGIEAQNSIVPLASVKKIADQKAIGLWGSAKPDNPLAYYSKDDELIGYRFTYSFSNGFPDKKTLQKQCFSAGEQGNRKLQWGIDTYGTMFISACKDMSVIQDYSKSLSPEYAFGYFMEEKANEKIGGEVTLKRAYYINFQNQWFCYTNGTSDIYIKVFPKLVLADHAEFHRIVDHLPFFTMRGDYTGEWDQYLSGSIGDAPSAQVWIPSHDGNCRFYDWSYGCSPTAAAMLLSYWDYLSLSSSSNYAKLIDYYFQRWDGIQNETDYQVPNTNKELAIAMNTDTIYEGGTDRDDIAPGYASVCNTTNGYNFTCTAQPSGQTVAYYWNFIVSEVGTNDRPIHISIPGHSECCVAYDAADLTIGVHNTWWEGVQWISRNQVERTYTIVPGGAEGLGIELGSPLGDTQYNHNGNGETFYAGDVYEISWSYDYSSGSYVKLYYSTNGGYNWTTITTNTENDGIYDWTIPAGISSTSCRIRITVYNSSDVFGGSDASLGNFKIYSGGSLTVLSEDAYVSTTREPDYYQFTSTSGYWNVVGTRPLVSGEDWDIALYDGIAFNNVVASSSYGGSAVDYVVLDGNHTSSLARGVKLNRYSGTGFTRVEFEGGGDLLTVGSPVTELWPAGDVVEMWDVYLTPGYYQCTMTINSGVANLGMALYGSSGSAYYAGRSAYIAYADAGGSGVSEAFGITITTADYYGLCIFANDANSASITLKFTSAGQWLGTVSNDWFNAANWSAAYVPTATTDVTINTGYTYYPIISSGEGYCNNITIGTGARISIGNADLNVAGNMTIYGEVEQTNINADFFVTGDVLWETGSTASILAAGEFHVDGDWEFRANANAQLNNGCVIFEGSLTSYIRNHQSNCSFYNVKNAKSASLVFYSSTSTDTLIIRGYYDNSQPTSILNCSSNYPLVLRGQLYNSGHIYCPYGTFIFDGTSHTINLNTGDYFNNLVISSTGNVNFSDTLHVHGDLTINSGALVAGGYPIFIEEDWINNVGTSGFSEGTGKVVFNGGNYHQYCSNETFNILEVDKASGGAFRINGTAVQCAQYNWTAGAVDVLSGSFTANDLADNGLYGSFYVNPGGTINLSNTDGFIDLNGYLYIYGGNFNIYGGSGFDSYWPYAANGGITMSNGTLDIKDVGVLVYNTGTYSLSENITGGTIRTARGFRVERADYTPAGGTLEFYGTTDGNFHTTNGGYVANVIVNKGLTDHTGLANVNSVIRHRETGLTEDAPSTSTVLLNDVADINGSLTISSGILSASSYTINVAGNWNNTVGTSGFSEGTGKVVFDGVGSADLLSAETFYNVDINKSYSGYDGLELMDDVWITGDLHIINGTLEMNNPSDLAVTGYLTIESGAGLNANDSYNANIAVGKNWTNYTYSSMLGFDPGNYSTVTFNGTVNQYLSTNALEEEFSTLVIDKTAGTFKPIDNLYANKDFLINDGIWEDNSSGLHHRVGRDFTVNSSGALYNAYPLNTFEFVGSNNSTLSYLSGTGYFHNIIVNKSTGYSLTQVGTTSCQFDGNMTIEEGTYTLNGYYLGVFGDFNINSGGTMMMPPGSQLVLSDLNSLNVNSGGYLNISGTAGDMALIRSNVTGAYYNLNVYSGGTIAADNCTFSRMNTNGIYIWSGAMVDVLHAFNGCTFSDGCPGGTLLKLNNNQVLTVRNVNFPANTWTGASNVSKTLNQGHVYLVDFTGGFSGEAFDDDTYGRVTWVNTLTANATATPASICNGQSSLLNANASGGLPPLTYLWSPATGLSDPASSSPVATPTSTTVYSVVVTDALGTTVTDDVTVTVSPLLPCSVSIVASANPVAPGTFVNFTATPVNGGTTPVYQWKVNGANVGTGLSTFTYTPANNDQVWCVLTSSESCASGSPATSNVISMMVIVTNQSVTGTVPAPIAVCFDATNTITVAGGGTTFVVQTGASVTMIAGVKISYLYGTMVEPGGYLHGYITTTNSYCGSLPPSMVAVVTGVNQESFIPATSLPRFDLFPNPTNGRFTLRLIGTLPDGNITTEIFSMRGEMVSVKNLASQRTYDFDLSGLPVGIYFLHITAGDLVQTIKIVLTR